LYGTLYKRYFEFDARTCVTQLGLRQPPWPTFEYQYLARIWERKIWGTKRPRNESSKERNVLNLCFVPGNEMSWERKVQSPLTHNVDLLVHPCRKLVNWTL